MYPVHIVVLLFSCNICFVKLKATMSNLVPIASKKIMIRHDYNIDLDIVSGRSRSRSRFVHFPSHGLCTVLPPTTESSNYSFCVDFFVVYPVHLVILRGKVSAMYAPLTVHLDNKEYKRLNFSKESKISHSPVLSGRVIELFTQTEITVCSLEVYTCKPGKIGENCEQDCSLGHYGLACKQRCNCLSSSDCNKVSGHCPSGCKTTPSKKPEVCYNSAVRRIRQDAFVPTKTAIWSISQGPTFDLQSAHLYQANQQCINATTECESKSMYVKLALAKPITLYGIEITFTRFHLPLPFSISVKIDGKLCFGLTSPKHPLALGKHIFKCHRRNVIGRDILVRFTTFNKTNLMNSKNVSLYICHLKALECSSGVYGRNCRHLCSCGQLSDCDKTSGACPHGRCVNSTGRFCSITQIGSSLPHDHFYDDIRMADQDHKGKPYPSSLEVRLSRVYVINSVTLTLPDIYQDPHRKIEIFTDPTITVRSRSSDVREAWPGLPCVVQEPGIAHMSIRVNCPGVAKTVIVVVTTNSSVFEIGRVEVQVWSCVDGTFGSECEHQCNCEDTTERCDKNSGECLSGCAKGYKGVNCLQLCRQDDPDPVCPTRSCHCRGNYRGYCGPEPALCTRGCQSGWMGVSCLLPCPSGYFGVQCEEKCGACLNANGTGVTETCLHTNGTCLFGCADPDDVDPTCRNGKRGPHRRHPETSGGVQSKTSARRVIEGSSMRVIVGLIGVIAACSMLVLMVCCSLKCYWDRLAHSKRLNERRIDLVMRRTMRAQVDNKVHSEHQAYHEAIMKRELLRKAAEDHNADGKSPRARAKAKAEAIRKMILEMETQRRINRGGGNVGDENDEDEEQDPDQKVALWILRQDFSELIDRRKQRLKDYQGNPIHMTESPYRISETSLVKDIHALYDDIEQLGIP